jgi:hypothetical protein
MCDRSQQKSEIFNSCKQTLKDVSAKVTQCVFGGKNTILNIKYY